MRQTILVIDDDRHITDGLGMALECEGRTIIVCSDVESGELALQRFPVTDVVTDVQFSGLFGFEGLHFLERIRATIPQGRVILMTGYASDVLRGAAAGYGATTLLGKPFEIDELERLLGIPQGNSEPYELIKVPSIDEILSERMIGTAFQPIVAFRDSNGEPYAFEALARVRGGWPCGGPAELFQYASRRSRAVELNRAAAVIAVEDAAALPKNALVFINVDPPTFNDPRLITDLVAASQRSGLSLDRVVLEVTERSSMVENGVSAEMFEALRGQGVRFALDDHGSAYSHLSTISTIRPSFIKISGVFGTGFETNLDKERVIRHVVALAQDFGCATVLEGIESRETADAAASLGIELAQGYFFSKPLDISHWRKAAA
jgi:EAL domain-containing protein (putative c-di-GMP-specific phosphodiesterase class I)